MYKLGVSITLFSTRDVRDLHVFSQLGRLLLSFVIGLFHNGLYLKTSTYPQMYPSPDSYYVVHLIVHTTGTLRHQSPRKLNSFTLSPRPSLSNPYSNLSVRHRSKHTVWLLEPKVGFQLFDLHLSRPGLRLTSIQSSSKTSPPLQPWTKNFYSSSNDLLLSFFS